MKKIIKKAIENIVIKAVRIVFSEEKQQLKNIDLNKSRVAYLQSAEYVLENMNLAKSLNSNYDLYDYVIDNFYVSGEILEFGVFTGNSIKYIANKFNDKIIYGFDSFVGLPEKWREGFEEGTFDLKGNLPLVPSNVKLIKGWFNDTIPVFLENKENFKIGLLHVDCDLYSSTKTILTELKDKICTGTIIVFDEYINYEGWQQGEFKAFQEFVDENNLLYSYLAYNSNHEQVAVIINES